MSVFARVMALLMLAFWLPAVSVCAGKCASFAPDDLCCPESAERSSDERANRDGNCVFTHALVKIQDDESGVGEVPMPPAVIQLLSMIAPRAESPRHSPPEDFVQTLSHEWQFITRTALSPRAPSFVS